MHKNAELSLAKNGESIRSVARHYNVGVATIDRIKKVTNHCVEINDITTLRLQKMSTQS